MAASVRLSRCVGLWWNLSADEGRMNGMNTDNACSFSLDPLGRSVEHADEQIRHGRFLEPVRVAIA
jgi:hypothetical protein